MTTDPLYRLDPPLSSGVLVRRASRFTLETRLAGGNTGLLHLPNSGRLETVLPPGARILYRPRPREDGKRVTDGNAVMAEVPGLGWVTIDATLLCRAFSHSLRVAAALAGAGDDSAEPVLAGLHGEFGSYAAVKDEVSVRGRRFDIGLAAAEGDEPGYLVEVKSVTLARDGVGLFPDAPTVRGAEHVRVLGELAGEGRRTGLVFAVGRPDARLVRPNSELDSHFAANLAAAVKAGLKVMAVYLQASPEGIRLARSLPVEVG